jgi:GH15 family glucan-1,4-alpha-glucosidase
MTAPSSPMPLEAYAMIGNLRTAALVSRAGAIDWLCAPRFDSAASFAALLGDERNGRWLLHPATPPRSISRRYREGTLVLETDFETSDGAVRIIDVMPVGGARSDVVRVVEGLRGRVAMRMELTIRPDYGATVPWVQRDGDDLVAVAGPYALRLQTPVTTYGNGPATRASFEVAASERLPFALSWYPSHEPAPAKP